VLTAGTQAGVAFKYADADNCLVAYHDGSVAHIMQMAGGTYSEIASQAVAHAAGTVWSVNWVNGNQYRCYYGSQAIGGLLTVNAVLVNNTGVKTFDTLGANVVADLEVYGQWGAA
jgi:hypothetical protein